MPAAILQPLEKGSKHQPYKKLLHHMKVLSFVHAYAVDDFGLYTNPPMFASRG